MRAHVWEPSPENPDETFQEEIIDLEEGFAAVAEGALVTIGEQHACAIEAVDEETIGGEIVCWHSGRDKYKLLDVPDGIFVQVSAGTRHTCAVRVDGSLVCWGFGDWVDKPPAGSFVQVASGDEHACALRKDGTVRCFGHCGIGQCEPPPGMYVQVAASGHASCGVFVNGTARCWGFGTTGPRGFGHPPRGVQFAQVAVSTSKTACGVTVNASMVCWGSIVAHPDEGQLLVREGAYIMATAGHNLYCGLLADSSTISCDGNIFHLSKQAKHLPSKDDAWAEITARHGTICGIQMSPPHEVQCWGGGIANHMPEHPIHAAM